MYSHHAYEFKHTCNFTTSIATPHLPRPSFPLGSRKQGQAERTNAAHDRQPSQVPKQTHGHQPCPISDNYTYINLLWSECQVIERSFVWKIDNRHDDALGFGLVSFSVSVRVNTALLRYQPVLQYKYAINDSVI